MIESQAVRPARRTATLTIALFLASFARVPIAGAEDRSGLSREAQAPEVRLVADRVTLPITMVQEFPFIESKVSGVRGKLMLDTGAAEALILNDHRVPVINAREVGSSFFGSGQHFSIRLAPIVQDVQISALDFPKVTNVITQDATQLESITKDFNGWFGFYAWSDHVLKLDFAHKKAMFLKGGPADFLHDEKVLAALPFESRKLPNHPIIRVRLGDVEGVGAFDTGQYGTLFTDEASKRRLLAEGNLSPSRRSPGTYDLHQLKLGGMTTLQTLKGIEVKTTKFAAAAPIGLTEATVLTLGYSLLRQYKTVWDFQGKTIYLLKR